jgi:hypothetical protein
VISTEFSSNFAKALWPGIKAFYDKAYGVELFVFPTRIKRDLNIRYDDYSIYLEFLKYLGITDALPFKDDNWITHFKMMVRLYGDT